MIFYWPHTPLHLFLEILLLAGTAMDIYLCVRMLFSYVYASVVNFACSVPLSRLIIDPKSSRQDNGKFKIAKCRAAIGDSY